MHACLTAIVGGADRGQWWRCAVYAWCLCAAACGPADPDELMADAREALARHETSTAEIHLKNLLLEQPGNAEARVMLGRVALDLGDPVMAEAQFRRALALGVDAASLQPSLLRALSAQRAHERVLEQIEAGPAPAEDERAAVMGLAAAAHRALGDLEQAEATYRSALALAPASTRLRAELADLVLATGRIDEAQEIVASLLALDPGFPQALVLRGRIEALAGRYDDAAATFRDAMRSGAESGPSYIPALSHLIEVQLARGDIDDAAAGADLLLSRAPESLGGRLLKATVEVAQGELDSARARLESLVAEAPRYTAALRLLGAIDLQQSRPGQAEMYLRAAVANDPADERALALLARAYLLADKIEEARELLSSVLPVTLGDSVLLALAGRATAQAGDPDRAARYFELSEGAAPAKSEELLGLVSIYVGSGELERAARVLDSSDVDIEDRSAASFLLALVYLSQDNPTAADELAERLSNEYPDVAWPLALRATVSSRAGEADQAREFLTAALVREPGNESVLLSLARVEASLGRFDEAAAALRRVLDIDPDHAAAMLYLGELALRRGMLDEAADWLGQVPESVPRWRLEASLAAIQGRNDDAAALLARAFEREPTAETAMSAFRAARRASSPDPEAVLLDWLERDPGDAQALFEVGATALEHGDESEAVRRFESVLEHMPDHAAALNNLAWLYARRGDDRSLAMGVRAYAAAPENPAIADTLGWLHVGRGEPAAGLPFLEQAVRALPEHPQIRYHWAAALAATGDSETAVAALEELLGQNRPFDGRDDAATLLATLRRQSSD